MFSSFNMKRSSGLDFHDRTAVAPDIHPDLPPTTLQRNKTERFRLQGLMRSDSAKKDSSQSAAQKALGIADRWRAWMVNEGGRRIFFGLFLLLHIIVGVLGTLQYGLKSNLSNARKTFGSTFGQHQVVTAITYCHLTTAVSFLSDRSFCCSYPSR